MPKSQEQIHKLKLERKQNIILSALKVFCEKGYDGATVDDIAKKAECSHGLFYHYFKSKKEIFDAVIENAGERSDKTVETILKEDLSCTEKLRKIVTYLFDNLKKDESTAYYFYFFFSRRFVDSLNGKKHECKHTTNRKPMFFLIEELFEEGIKNGEFKDIYPAKEYGKLLHSIIQGVTMAYTVMPIEIKKSFNPPKVELIVNIFKNT